MADRSHLSIGEVLSLLREEFPDVTISKIRFLESQGLVDPERTPSGYRKFYEHDVERLRWILRQQREHFLPLKVIRGRLSEQGGDGEPEGEAQPADLSERAAVAAGAPWAAASGVEAHEPAMGRVEPAASDTGRAPSTPPPGPPVGRPAEPAAVARPMPVPSLFAGLHATEQPAARPAQPGPAASPGPAAVPAPVTAAPAAPPGGAGGPAPVEEPDTYTAEELAAAAGADPALVNDLKQFGLIAPHAVVAGTSYYDASAVAVTRAAAEFARHGVEARHLRIWRNAADRETDLFQQVVLPLLRQRNPQARRQAADTLAELARAGGDLRAALVDRSLRDIR